MGVSSGTGVGVTVGAGGSVDDVTSSTTDSDVGDADGAKDDSGTSATSAGAAQPRNVDTTSRSANRRSAQREKSVRTIQNLTVLIGALIFPVFEFVSQSGLRIHNLPAVV